MMPSWITRRFSRSDIPRLIILVGIVVSPLIVPMVGIFRHLDTSLVDLRFSAAPRNATGAIAFVAIDKQSLDAVGSWPWPRSIYADLVDRLVAAGTGDIFIDIDFSSPSRPEEDQRLAEALAAAGGGVILPVFEQQVSVNDGSNTVVTRPIPALLDAAWPAFANVALSPDGMVETFSLSGVLDGQVTQSVPAALAQLGDAQTGEVTIDYSILPSTVPTFSLADVLAGKVGANELEGKSVVVGAYATELKDIFPVPVYGTLSGPMIHVMAAETLSQGRALWEIDERPVGLLFGTLIVVLILSLRSRSAVYTVTSVVLLVAAVETAAFLLQKHQGLHLHTASIWIPLVLGLLLLVSEKFDLTHWLAEIARAKYKNTSTILKRVVADSADAVVIFDEQLKVVDKSRSTRAIFGKATMAAQLSMDSFAPADLLASIHETVAKFRASPGMTQTSFMAFQQDDGVEVRYLEAVVTLSPLEIPAVLTEQSRSAFVGCLTVKDVTARHQYHVKLLELSERDQLTGLLNRRALGEYIEISKGQFSIFVIDLHRFATLNATLGRGMGDDLLQAVADRLTAHIGDKGAVGRLNGDVFCVARPTAASFDESREAESLLKLLDEPFTLKAMTVETAARIGVCVGQPDIGMPASWIEAAEMALDDAKTIAGAGYKFYNHERALKQARSRLLEQELRKGLSSGQFFVLYQPQVDLQTGKLVGAEALLRWKHPDFGIVSPVDFIEIAEANGFICDLGRWILNEACLQAAEWPDDLHVAVNVSAIQLKKSDLLADVRHALEKSGLPAARLHLEITESMFVDGADSLADKLNVIRSMGIKIALDDFGTGYSSLGYIAGFPLDKLKIDQSFVRRMQSDAGSLAIVRAIAALAEGIGFEVVCEGIEGEVEWKMLAALGCQQGQGYFFGKPQTGAEFIRMSGQNFAPALAG